MTLRSRSPKNLTLSNPLLIALALIGLLLTGVPTTGAAQSQDRYVSNVWVADNGDGTYKNPIIHADYSDPDPVPVKVGNYFYMTASSFNTSPGLPILRSKDLVNWEIIGHAIDPLVPYEYFKEPRHAQGVWAPSFRYHDGEFYIFWGDPDFGIYMVKTDDPAGEWEDPVLIHEGKGLIDPSPLWDDDGRAYLVHAFAGSRAGIKSLLVVHEMSPDGTEMLDKGTLVFDGHDEQPTIEGPKFYKQNGYYYILAPAGGVTQGWQLALRSKNVLGPYDARKVMHQGNTDINGPHQGGLVDLASGETWFIHFQDQEAYGRVVHLNPVRWKNGWPMMGEDKNNDGIGEPVSRYKKPDVGGKYPVQTPQESDEFNKNKLGLQWQWHANPENTWVFPAGNNGYLRLFAVQRPDDFQNYWDIPNLLLQKFPAPSFTATTKFKFYPNMDGEKTGLIIMGKDYSYLSVTRKPDGLYVSQVICRNADEGAAEKEIDGRMVDSDQLWFRVEAEKGAMCRFSYSTNGKSFKPIGDSFQAVPGGWIGAKVGIFATRPEQTHDAGYADFDWFRVTENK